MGLSQDRTLLLVSSTHFWLQENFSLLGLLQVPKNNFNQKDEKTQKERKIVKQDKIMMAEQLKSGIFSSHPRALGNTLSHVL